MSVLSFGRDGYTELDGKHELLMKHEHVDDFARSAWQGGGGSPAPLLAWRAAKLAWALGVWAWSLAGFWGPRALWCIYMTHWGITAIALQALLALYISVAALRRKLPEPTFGLPWYVQAYWVLFNITAPAAFLITLFYWTVLYTSDMLVDYAPNIFLDVSLHGVNSLVMLAEVLAAGHPSRLLHLYQPVGFGLLYLLFGLIYYFAGGVDPWGNPWVYPVIDWSNPGPTAGVVAATTLVVILLHFFTVGLARLRDFLAGRLLRKADPPSPGFSNDTFIAA